MRYRNLFGSLKRLNSRGDIMNGVQQVRAVISVPAFIADSDNDILQNDESILMLECLALYLLQSNFPFAILALIAIHGHIVFFKPSLFPDPVYGSSGGSSWYALRLPARCKI